MDKSWQNPTDLCKDTWVSVKEVLVQYRVIVGERLRQPAQAGGWDLLEGRLVRLKPDWTNIIIIIIIIIVSNLMPPTLRVILFSPSCIISDQR